jgi:hypothetical protein
MVFFSFKNAPGDSFKKSYFEISQLRFREKSNFLLHAHPVGMVANMRKNEKIRWNSAQPMAKFLIRKFVDRPTEDQRSLAFPMNHGLSPQSSI